MAAPAKRSGFADARRWPGPPDQVLRPRTVAPLPDARAALRHALEQPVGCPPLADLAGSARRVAVVLPDSTRPRTPWPVMLDAVLDVLFAAGRPPEQVTLVIGNGMHPLRGPEALGLDAEHRRGCRVVDHDALDRAQLVDLGRVPAYGAGFLLDGLRRVAWDAARSTPAGLRELARALRGRDGAALRRALNAAPFLRPVLVGMAASGTRVRVNRAVAEADLVVGLSRVKPHPLSGYSGGAKSIYPAAGDRIGVGRNHLVQVHPDTRPGEVDGNLLRRGLESAVALLRRPFVVNAVTDGEGRWCHVTAGEPVASHRAALPVARRIAEVPARRSDVVLFANGEQGDLDLYQFSKSYLQAAGILRPGGVAIGVAALPLGAQGAGPQGVAVGFGQGVYYGLGIRPLLERGVRLFLVAPDAPRIARGTPYRGFASAEAALAAAVAGRRKAHITHLPDVDSVLPVSDGAGGRAEEESDTQVK